jgi:hypothetical protein
MLGGGGADEPSLHDLSAFTYISNINGMQNVTGAGSQAIPIQFRQLASREL